MLPKNMEQSKDYICLQKEYFLVTRYLKDQFMIQPKTKICQLITCPERLEGVEG